MKVNLINYLPYELRKIQEFEQICESENPEFDRMDDIVKSIFDENFVESASEYGISRLEKIAGIVPDFDDNLEDRRFRLMVRYQFKLPYTFATLMDRLDVICGKDEYELEIRNDSYELVLKTRMTTSNQYNELIFLLEQVIPANMLVLSSNTLLNKYEKDLYYGSVLIEKKTVNISNEIDKDYINESIMYMGQAISEYKSVSVSNDLDIIYNNSDNIYVSCIISEYKAVEIKMEGMI